MVQLTGTAHAVLEVIPVAEVDLVWRHDADGMADALVFVGKARGQNVRSFLHRRVDQH